MLCYISILILLYKWLVYNHTHILCMYIYILLCMLGQKEISNTWIKYIYLLLEAAIRDCKANDTLFYNLDG